MIVNIEFVLCLLDEIEAQDQCICWCQGWAEIHIRRPTGMEIIFKIFSFWSLLWIELEKRFSFPSVGDISWVMRIQNDTNSVSNSDPMIDVSTLGIPSLIQEGVNLQDSKVGFFL